MSNNTASQELIDKFEAFCKENGIDEMVCIAGVKGVKTLVIHTFQDERSEVYDIIEKKLWQTVHAISVLQGKASPAEFTCKNCGNGGSSEQIDIYYEKPKFVERCPYCKSDKLEMI